MQQKVNLIVLLFASKMICRLGFWFHCFYSLTDTPCHVISGRWFESDMLTGWTCWWCLILIFRSRTDGSWRYRSSDVLINDSVDCRDREWNWLTVSKAHQVQTSAETAPPSADHSDSQSIHNLVWKRLDRRWDLTTPVIITTTVTLTVRYQRLWAYFSLNGCVLMRKQSVRGLENLPTN